MNLCESLGDQTARGSAIRQRHQRGARSARVRELTDEPGSTRSHRVNDEIVLDEPGRALYARPTAPQRPIGSLPRDHDVMPVLSSNPRHQVSLLYPVASSFPLELIDESPFGTCSMRIRLRQLGRVCVYVFHSRVFHTTAFQTTRRRPCSWGCWNSKT